MKPISEMTDQEIVEVWFVEVHGWQDTGRVWRLGNPIAYCSQPKFLKQPDGQEVCLGIMHNILDSETAFNQWVNAYMEERGWLLSIGSNEVHWFNAYDQRSPHIWHNCRRFRAAVEGALQIIREGE